MPRDGPLRGTRVGATAAPSSEHVVVALERMGADVVWGPTVELTPASPLRVEAETAAVVSADPAWVVATTEYGMNRWLDGAASCGDELRALLARRPVAARSARVARALSSRGVSPTVTALSAREVPLARLVAARAGGGQVVAVQVAGGGSPRLLEELTAAGVEALTVRPYRWKVPDDRGGTHRLVDELLDGQVDVMVFTSPPAVNGLFEVAADLGRADAVWAALTDGTAVAVVGPATAEAVEARRLPVSICPLQPRSDALLHALAAWRSLPQLRPAITVDAGARHVAVERSELPLSDLEFALVASLARRAGVTCTTPVLLREVWGEAGDRRRLEVLVSRVRPRLAALGLSIESVPKRGYRLASEDG